MKVHVLTGSKSEIAEEIVRIDGAIHEALVFVDEPDDPLSGQSEGDIFAEMAPFTVAVGGADYLRQSLYAPLEGE
jgi:hypothetical protein